MNTLEHVRLSGLLSDKRKKGRVGRWETGMVPKTAWLISVVLPIGCNLNGIS